MNYNRSEFQASYGISSQLPAADLSLIHISEPTRH